MTFVDENFAGRQLFNNMKKRLHPMEIDFRTLANRYISDLIPYQPGKPIEELERELGITSAIKLASNENPLGASPLAITAAKKALEKAHFYPDGGCFELKQALAKFLTVNPIQLTIGNGSENILEIIVKAYLTQKSSAVISQYAFLTIPLLIKSYGAEIICVPATNFRHNIEKMLTAVTQTTRVLFIVNPNNPTGTYTTTAELLHLLDSIPSHILVVVDEAYNEYIDREDYPDTLTLLKKYPNLIITRTFSKAYGLAALRLGYAVSSPEIADILNRARLPFNVNSIAACAAQAALLDHQHISNSIALNTAGMKQVETKLKMMNVDYIPSLGNFITIDVKQSAADIYQKLLHKGIIVRPLGAYDMANHIRVTIGTTEQNARFLQAFSEVL
jgi:histidinol-phosphate aminotransferase